MCIALLSTAHPSYQLILVDNRDEYLNRPTAKAKWWPEPHNDVLGGRDLLRDIQGTWLGITKNGKIAVLTNFREDQTPPSTAVSRGAIIRKWLTENVGSTEEFASQVIDTGIARDAGGFSLVCGNVGEKLTVISNRAKSSTQVPFICGDVVQTVGLSNAAFTDRSWRKVREGEELMLQTIQECVRESETEDRLIEKLLHLLSRDTLKRVHEGETVGLETYIKELRNTIRVPAIGRRGPTNIRGDEFAAAKTSERVKVPSSPTPEAHTKLGVSGLYGTQKQTVVLVDHDWNVRFFERTLFDSDSKAVEAGKGDIDVKFRIQGR